VTKKIKSALLSVIIKTIVSHFHPEHIEVTHTSKNILKTFNCLIKENRKPWMFSLNLRFLAVTLTNFSEYFFNFTISFVVVKIRTTHRPVPYCRKYWRDNASFLSNI
jgi:hypothetical protein